MDLDLMTDTITLRLRIGHTLANRASWSWPYLMCKLGLRSPRSENPLPPQGLPTANICVVPVQNFFEELRQGGPICGPPAGFLGTGGNETGRQECWNPQNRTGIFLRPSEPLKRGLTQPSRCAPGRSDGWFSVTQSSGFCTTIQGYSIASAPPEGRRSSGPGHIGLLFVGLRLDPWG